MAAYGRFFIGGYMPIRVIKGDTFAPVFRRLGDKTRAPINLSDSILTINIHSANFTLNILLDCQVLDQSIAENVGRYTINPVDTSEWPVGQLTMKSTRIVDGVTASIIGTIVVEAG